MLVWLTSGSLFLEPVVRTGERFIYFGLHKIQIFQILGLMIK